MQIVRANPNPSPEGKGVRLLSGSGNRTRYGGCSSTSSGVRNLYPSAFLLLVLLIGQPQEHPTPAHRNALVEHQAALLRASELSNLLRLVQLLVQVVRPVLHHPRPAIKEFSVVTLRVAPVFWTREIGLRLMSSRPDHIANSTSPCMIDRTCVLDFGDKGTSPIVAPEGSVKESEVE